MARHTGIEPVSAARQAARLTKCVMTRYFLGGRGDGIPSFPRCAQLVDLSGNAPAGRPCKGGPLPSAQARYWYTLRESNPLMSGCKPDAFPSGAACIEVSVVGLNL